MADAILAWLERHTAQAPPVLRTRVREHTKAVTGSVEPIALGLARASRVALKEVCSEPTGTRSIALDLLAADALITLSLLAQAQSAPEALEQFAASLLTRPVGAA